MACTDQHRLSHGQRRSLASLLMQQQEPEGLSWLLLRQECSPLVQGVGGKQAQQVGVLSRLTTCEVQPSMSKSSTGNDCWRGNGMHLM